MEKKLSVDTVEEISEKDAKLINVVTKSLLSALNQNKHSENSDAGEGIQEALEKVTTLENEITGFSDMLLKSLKKHSIESCEEALDGSIVLTEKMNHMYDAFMPLYGSSESLSASFGGLEGLVISIKEHTKKKIQLMKQVLGGEASVSIKRTSGLRIISSLFQEISELYGALGSIQKMRFNYLSAVGELTEAIESDFMEQGGFSIFSYPTNNISVVHKDNLMLTKLYNEIFHVYDFKSDKDALIEDIERMCFTGYYKRCLNLEGITDEEKILFNALYESYLTATPGIEKIKELVVHIKENLKDGTTVHMDASYRKQQISEKNIKNLIVEKNRVNRFLDTFSLEKRIKNIGLKKKSIGNKEGVAILKKAYSLLDEIFEIAGKINLPGMYGKEFNEKFFDLYLRNQEKVKERKEVYTYISGVLDEKYQENLSLHEKIDKEDKESSNDIPDGIEAYEQSLNKCLTLLRKHKKSYNKVMKKFESKEKENKGSRLNYTFTKDDYGVINGLEEQKMTMPPKAIGKTTKVVEEKIQSIIDGEKYDRYLMGGFSGIEASNSRNFMITGPNGCGKGALMKQMSWNKDVVTINMSYADMASYFVSAEEQSVAKIFDFAEEKAKELGKPVIIFFDECDALVQSKGLNAYKNKVMEQLQIELDGSNNREGVYFIGVTNKPEKFPMDIFRRLDLVVFEKLDAFERTDLMLSRLDVLPFDEEVSLLVKNLANDSGSYDEKYQEFVEFLMTITPKMIHEFTELVFRKYIGSIPDEFDVKSSSGEVSTMKKSKMNAIAKKLSKKYKGTEKMRKEYNALYQKTGILLDRNSINDAFLSVKKKPTYSQEIENNQVFYDNVDSVMSEIKGTRYVRRVGF